MMKTPSAIKVCAVCCNSTSQSAPTSTKKLKRLPRLETRFQSSLTKPSLRATATESAVSKRGP